jgi:hypothetical protein
VVQYQTPAEAPFALDDGKADAALVDHASALEAIGAGRRMHIWREPVVLAPCGAVVQHESQQVPQATNSALTATEDDGTKEKLVAQGLMGQGQAKASGQGDPVGEQ